MVMTAMTATALPYALDDYDLILDFSFPPWFLPTAQTMAGRREIPLDYVVLRPSEAVCAARAASRAEGRMEDYTPYHDLYLSFDAASTHRIEDDASDVATLAAQVRAGLKAGKFRV